MMRYRKIILLIERKVDFNLSDEEITQAFQIFDTKNNGSITFE